MMPWISATKLLFFSHLNFLWYLGVPEKVQVVEKSKKLWYHTESVSGDFKHLIFPPRVPEKVQVAGKKNPSGIKQNLFQMISSN